MAETWNVTVSDNGFTATVTNDDGSWSYTLSRGNSSSSGDLPTSFAWTSNFSMGANGGYAFSGGQLNNGVYTGTVTYPSAAAVATNWTAQKKANVAAA